MGPTVARSSMRCFQVLVALILGVNLGAHCHNHQDILRQSRGLLQDFSVRIPSESWVGNPDGKPGKAFGSCQLQSGGQNSPIEDTNCEAELVCVPILAPAETPSRLNALERKGVCVRFPGDASYIFDSIESIPIPRAYFPLINEEFSSWPLNAFRSENQEGLKFTDDEVFGRVVFCSEEAITLPSINYALQGQFSVNFWIKKDSSKDGIGFEYIFSHMKNGSASGIRQESQIQIYMPREGLPAHGFLRAIVKDNNDMDEGAASDSFLDSDGRVADNQPRELPRGHPDLFDNQWHMITLTSNKLSKTGFRLYIDGKLRGQLSEGATAEINGTEVDMQVGGGDPIDLSGNIVLCSRSDMAPDRFFEGSIAHVSLFDEMLTEDSINKLYTTFFTARAQLMIPTETSNKVSINNAPCIFPAVLRGSLVNDCTPVDGVLQCPVGPGQWQQCELLPSSSVDQVEQNVITEPLDSSTGPDDAFFTVDGELCDFPTFYAGKIQRVCVELNGERMCPVKGQRAWKQCADEGLTNDQSADTTDAVTDKAKQRLTLSGESCAFPFFHNGNEYNDCAFIGNHWSCRVEGGELVECGVKRDPGTDPSVNSSAPIVTRVTVDGEQCFFPFWFDGKATADCVDIDGELQCAKPDGEMYGCRPLQITTSGKPCALPFFHEGQWHNECIDIDGFGHCKIADGSFEACTPPGSMIPPPFPPPPKANAILPGRVTVDGTLCSFPFWFGGELHSTCVQMTEDEPAEFCRTRLGDWEECTPQRETEDGSVCSIPFLLDDEPHFDCTMHKGKYRCITASGKIRVCKDVPGGFGFVEQGDQEKGKARDDDDEGDDIDDDSG